MTWVTLFYNICQIKISYNYTHINDGVTLLLIHDGECKHLAVTRFVYIADCISE